MASATMDFKACGESSKCRTSVWSNSRSIPVTFPAFSCSSSSTSGYRLKKNMETINRVLFLYHAILKNSRRFWKTGKLSIPMLKVGIRAMLQV
ncbi:guanine nucleotide exchange factor DBS [Corchorus capsularis]|uniref:Guanine nucleotide exchange factor DBS n=1 Tax=Corchorus capsularis TaxID=210143 RepID=A0A1R3HQR3_COCAP|nr:guanine nucleotide exchange factor DBS [Corchorus capsularis]